MFSIYASWSEDPETDMFDNKTIANIFNGLAQTLNLFVFICSVTVIIPNNMFSEDGYGWNTARKWYYQFRNVYVHILPFISSTINVFLLSDIIIYMFDQWYILLILIAYLLTSFWYTKLNPHNHKLYGPILTFDDWISVFTVVISLFSAGVFQFLNAILT